MACLSFRAASLSLRPPPSHSVFRVLVPRYHRKPGQWVRHKTLCSAGATAGSPAADENPYKVLGVSPLEKFESVKLAYTKKHKDAEMRGDDAAVERIERAYDKIMMVQLANRKQGLTFGSLEVSKDIKYADKQPLFPWGPRYSRSSKKDILINLAISTIFGIWIIYAQSAEWKPLQFLIFGYMWRVFDKLKDFEPKVSSSDEENQTKRSGKRLLRTIGLVFSCIAVSSLAFTGILNAYELLGFYIPRAFINSQELFVTFLSAVSLFFMGSYYR